MKNIIITTIAVLQLCCHSVESYPLEEEPTLIEYDQIAIETIWRIWDQDLGEWWESPFTDRLPGFFQSLESATMEFEDAYAAGEYTPGQIEYIEFLLGEK